jgi:hypothetical protein
MARTNLFHSNSNLSDSSKISLELNELTLFISAFSHSPNKASPKESAESDSPSQLNKSRRQEIHLIEDELDNQSSSSEEEIITVSEEETNTFLKTRDYDYIVGIILGFVLGFCANVLLQ